MRKLLCVTLVAAMGCVRAPVMTNNSGMSSGNSAQSSGNSANSSNGSGTSGQSAQSSGNSAQSSQASQNSSGGSQASSGSSQQSSQNSGGSSAASAQTTAQGAASSVTVAGSVLLVAVAGGIMTTVFTAADRRNARLQQAPMQQLQEPLPPGPVPQPMPYKVEPIPPDPNQPPPTPEGPGFTPKPFPKKTEIWHEQGPSLDAMVMARSWLKANELQLAADLGLGLGPALDDLAYISGIAPSHRAHFGKVLQRERARLVVSRDLTPEGAASLMRVVGELVLADPVLRGDAVAMLAER
ncbi:MAG TPA: hypothetical protein VGD87_07695 [Archangium sp.]